MQVELQGFRSHHSSFWIFDIGESNYVRGDNGAGKSDIYRAITWAIYGKSTNIYMPGNKQTVVVKLKYLNISIRRQALPNSIVVTLDDKKSTGLEADRILLDYFGSREKWDLATYITQASSHNFITARAEERMNIINRLTGNEEGVRAKIDGLIKDAKVEVKVYEKLYSKAESVHETKYGSYKIFLKHRRTEAQMEQLEKKIQDQNEELISYRHLLNKKQAIEKEIRNTAFHLNKLQCYNDTEYQKKKSDLALFEQYSTALYAFERYKVKFPKQPKKYTQQDYNQSVIDQECYNKNKEKALALDLEYAEKEIGKQIELLTLGIKYHEQAKEKALYKTQLIKVKKLKSLVLQESKNIPQNPQEFIETTEKSLQYISAFHIQRQRSKILKSLESLKSVAHVTSKDVEFQSFLVENQWLFEKHESYKALKKELDLDVTLEMLESWQQELKDAENSCNALACPHCKENVYLQNNDLCKYKGRVVKNIDIDTLKKQIALGKKIYSQTPPELPKDLVVVNVSETRDYIDKSRRYLSLQQELALMEDPLIPENVQEIENISQAQLQLETARRILQLQSQLVIEEEYLTTLNNPEIPSNVQIIENIQEAQELLVLLRNVEFYPNPVSPTTIVSAIEWHRLKDALPDFVQEIGQKQVDEYHARLAEKNVFEIKSKQLKKEIEKHTATEADFVILQEKSLATEKELELAQIYKKVCEARRILKGQQKELETCREYVGQLKEYKDIHLKATKAAMDSTLYTIQSGVNDILKILLTKNITIEMSESNNKLKLEFFSNGVNYGDPKEMSGGERSVLSFAFIIVFNQLTNSKILILDEATEGLSQDRKDDCIEYLLEYIQKQNKTLMITDHSCHTGDYHKIINVV